MPAWIAGQPAPQAQAIAAAAKLLGAARSPLVAGFAAEVEAIRAAYRLALRLGASVDVSASDTVYAGLSALAGSGAMQTTAAEARARADTLLVVGESPWRSPRLTELLHSAPARTAETTARRVVALRSAQATHSAPGEAAPGLHGEVPVARFDTALAYLRGVVAGRLPPAAAAIDVTPAIGPLRQARFGVAVYDPLELGELAVEMLHGLVKDLNAAERFTTLAVDDADVARAAVAVGTWTTSSGPRVGLGRGYPEHDPWRFRAERLMADGEADAALWLATLPAPLPPWLGRGPAAAVLGEARGDECEVVIAAAVPGETGAGTIWHGARGTLVHSEAARPGPEPGAAAVLAEILAAVDAAPGAGDGARRPC